MDKCLERWEDWEFTFTGAVSLRRAGPVLVLLTSSWTPLWTARLTALWTTDPHLHNAVVLMGQVNAWKWAIPFWGDEECFLFPCMEFVEEKNFRNGRVTCWLMHWDLSPLCTTMDHHGQDESYLYFSSFSAAPAQPCAIHSERSSHLCCLAKGASKYFHKKESQFWPLENCLLITGTETYI